MTNVGQMGLLTPSLALQYQCMYVQLSLVSSSVCIIRHAKKLSEAKH